MTSADVDRNYISLIELGRNSPSVRMVFRLCDALDITPSDMLKDVERHMKVQQGKEPGSGYAISH